MCGLFLFDPVIFFKLTLLFPV